MATVLSTLAVGSAAGAARSAHYAYTFEITGAKLVATYTLRGAKTVTTLHTKAPSRTYEIAWTGRHGDSRSPRLTFVGQASYSSRVAACSATSTFPANSTQFYVGAQATGVRILVERFPVGGIGDGLDNGATALTPPKCGYPASSYFDDADILVPFASLEGSTAVGTATKPQADLGSGDTLGWTLQVTIKRVSLRLLN